MKPKKCVALFSICSVAGLMIACGQNESTEGRLQVNKKYVLESWPDSAYIADLDSILKAEPLKPGADSERTELTIYSGNIPTIHLPGQKKASKQATASAENRTVAASPANTAKPAKAAERFADNFMNALGAFRPAFPCLWSGCDEASPLLHAFYLAVGESRSQARTFKCGRSGAYSKSLSF